MPSHSMPGSIPPSAPAIAAAIALIYSPGAVARSMARHGPFAALPAARPVRTPRRVLDHLYCVCCASCCLPIARCCVPQIVETCIEWPSFEPKKLGRASGRDAACSRRSPLSSLTSSTRASPGLCPSPDAIPGWQCSRRAAPRLRHDRDQHGLATRACDGAKRLTDRERPPRARHRGGRDARPRTRARPAAAPGRARGCGVCVWRILLRWVLAICVVLSTPLVQR
jgi:hypothetical protein